MDQYDVVIIGAGPAGLNCAKILSEAGKNVLLLEKNSEIGPKVCAGGLSQGSLAYLNLPDDLIENKFYNITLHSPRQTIVLNFDNPIISTINRKNLGKWQFSRLNV